MKRLVEEVGQKIISALDRLGIGYQTEAGEWWGVCFSSAGYTTDKTKLVFTVDTNPGRLPRGVSLTTLTDKKVLQHLSGVIGHPVYADTRRGVRYIVVLDTTPKQRLPKKVTLDRSTMRALLHASEGAQLLVGLGFTRAEHWWVSWDEITHMVVGGTTGGGKSTFVESLVYQNLHQSPDRVRLVLGDRKRVTLAPIQDVPHLLFPVAFETQTLTQTLTGVLEEMERREALFTGTGRFPTSLGAYNKVAGRPLPRIVIIIDEAGAWLAESGGKKGELHHLLERIAMLGRALGIHLVLTGQNLRAEAFGPGMRDQLMTRIQFMAADATQARIIGAKGAERIRTPGRALIQVGGKRRLTQTYFVNREALVNLAKRLRTKPLPVLTDFEAELVRYAAANLEGRFPVGQLCAAFGNEHAWQIRSLAKRWEQRGWLTHPRHATDARRLTPELRHMAGLESAQPEAKIVVNSVGWKVIQLQAPGRTFVS